MLKDFYKTCPICKKRGSPSFFEIEGYWYCTYCHLGWLKKRPTVLYEESYYKGASNIANKLFTPIEIFFYMIRKSFAGWDRKKLWIDVGAGDGAFLKTVNAEKKIGVEISVSGRAIMKKNGLSTLSNEEFLKTEGLNADIISYWNVLEHVDKPWEYLKAGKRNLSKKGKIIIGVPNCDSFEIRYFRNYWFHLLPQYHFWHFSPKSMTLLLNQVEFKLRSIDYWSIEHHLTGILQSFINKTAGSDNVLHRLVKRGLDYKPSFKDIFWIIFWLTIGLPIVFLFWIISSLWKKSGTIVLVAKI